MTLRSSRYVLFSSLLLFLSGCVEESSTIVTFDEVLQSTTFENRLLAPVVLYRDGEILDTLPATTTRLYDIGRKGPVRHAWKLVAPLDRYGKKAGVEPSVDIGVQYVINARYEIDNVIDDEGTIFETREIFTPLIANFSPYPLRLIANYREDDQVITDYLLPRSIDSMLMHAPYFYWHSSSNVRVESTTSGFYRIYERADTIEATQLRLDLSSRYSGSGRTVPIVVY